jgi:PAS domain S-box-containing protein
MTAASILVVEDEGLIAAEIELRLQQLGYVVSGVVDNAIDVFDHAAVVRPDLVLLDVHIKGNLSGIDVGRRLRDEFHIPFIFMTAHADTATIEEAAALQPYGYIVKPFDKRSLAAAVSTALSRRRAEEAMARMEQWLMTTLNSIGDAVIATDAEYRVAFINPVAEALTGWTRSDALGRPLVEVATILDDDGNDLLSRSVDALAEGYAARLDNARLVRRDGSHLPISDSLAPIRDSGGAIAGVVLVFGDSSERRRLEQQLRDLNVALEERVRARTTQLQVANAELEAFANSIAHDLRAPLRAINAFSERLAGEHAEQLDEEGLRLLKVVTSRTRQMGSMIDDYLRLSKLGRVALQRTPLDMAALVRAAWATVTAGEPTQARLEVGRLPEVDADAALMEQVWTNLLANALKFSRHLPYPQIRISGHDEGRVVRFTIEDNGVGFDPAHAGRLFQMFERLHPVADFEGNGVGLCVVRRIVNRHDGEVQIEGRPGHGVTVTFVLPKRSQVLEMVS